MCKSYILCHLPFFCVEVISKILRRIKMIFGKILIQAWQVCIYFFRAIRPRMHPGILSRTHRGPRTPAKLCFLAISLITSKLGTFLLLINGAKIKEKKFRSWSVKWVLLLFLSVVASAESLSACTVSNPRDKTFSPWRDGAYLSSTDEVWTISSLLRAFFNAFVVCTACFLLVWNLYSEAAVVSEWQSWRAVASFKCPWLLCTIVVIVFLKIVDPILVVNPALFQMVLNADPTDDESMALPWCVQKKGLSWLPPETQVQKLVTVTTIYFFLQATCYSRNQCARFLYNITYCDFPVKIVQ